MAKLDPKKYHWTRGDCVTVSVDTMDEAEAKQVLCRNMRELATVHDALNALCFDWDQLTSHSTYEAVHKLNVALTVFMSSKRIKS